MEDIKHIKTFYEKANQLKQYNDPLYHHVLAMTNTMVDNFLKTHEKTLSIKNMNMLKNIKSKSTINHSNQEIISHLNKTISSSKSIKNELDDETLPMKKRKRKDNGGGDDVDMDVNMDSIKTITSFFTFKSKKVPRDKILKELNAAIEWMNKKKCDKKVAISMYNDSYAEDLLEYRIKLDKKKQPNRSRALNLFQKNIYIILLLRKSVISGFLVFYVRTIEQNGLQLITLEEIEIGSNPTYYADLLMVPFIGLCQSYLKDKCIITYHSPGRYVQSRDSKLKNTFNMQQYTKNEWGWLKFNVTQLSKQYNMKKLKLESITPPKEDRKWSGATDIRSQLQNFLKDFNYRPYQFYTKDMNDKLKEKQKELFLCAKRGGMEKSPKFKINAEEIAPIIKIINQMLDNCLFKKDVNQNKYLYDIKLYDKSYKDQFVKLEKENKIFGCFTTDFDDEIEDGNALIAIATPNNDDNKIVSYLIFSFKKMELFNLKLIKIDFSCTDVYFRRSGLSTLLRLIPIWFARLYNLTTPNSVDRYTFIASETVVLASRKLLIDKFGFVVPKDVNFVDTMDILKLSYDDLGKLISLIQNGTMESPIPIPYRIKKLGPFLYDLMYTFYSVNTFLFMRDGNGLDKFNKVVNDLKLCKF